MHNHRKVTNDTSSPKERSAKRNRQPDTVACILGARYHLAYTGVCLDREGGREGEKARARARVCVCVYVFEPEMGRVSPVMIS